MNFIHSFIFRLIMIDCCGKLHDFLSYKLCGKTSRNELSGERNFDASLVSYQKGNFFPPPHINFPVYEDAELR